MKGEDTGTGRNRSTLCGELAVEVADDLPEDTLCDDDAISLQIT